MWKITRLYLKNFIHIYAGMNKKEITLDLSESNKKINIFIGKMGSGKSSVLGHLQPFATYGTLDVRNQEDLVIPGEDGVKEIDYLHNGVFYQICHKYSWNKNTKSHTTKSFIKMNGKEMNENGNVGTFKEIIKTEFGIDQNFLRLLRLGPNVSNLINMKSTERKSFIASLLKETDIYLLLHKKLTEDYRNLNGILSVLSNKLTSLSSDKQNEIAAEIEDLEDDLKEAKEKIDKINGEISRLQGMNSALASQKSLSELYDARDDAWDEESKLKKELDEIDNIMGSIPNIDYSELSVKYGQITANLNTINERILRLQETFTQNAVKKTKLNEFILLQDNTDQLHELEDKAEGIKNKYEKYSTALSNFKCGYSYSYLVGIPLAIQTFQMSLEDMLVNKKEIIGKMYNSDNTVISWAKKKLAILTGRQVNLKKLLSNLQFSAEYQCPIPLYRPPMCPTKDCPFIQTHPQIIKECSKDKRNFQIRDLQTQLEKMDIEISMYEDLISQYPKMEILKKSWETLSRDLNNLGVLRERNLYKLLIDLNARNSWYDYNALIDITEKAKMLEDYSQLQNQYYMVQNELLQLQNSDIGVKKKELEELNEREEKLLIELEDLQKDHIILTEDKQKTEDTLTAMKNYKSYEESKKNLEFQLNEVESKIRKINEGIDHIEINLQKIHGLKRDLDGASADYNKVNDKLMKLKVQMRDIESTKADYQGYLDERNVLKLILDAVSSKDGIPLVMVKVFLDQCKEIVNDLISDIFDDDLEIISFDISENSNEFKIPFRINGNDVSDIELASQGQQAVISIALSFALCRKSMFDYNIMLLDEIDNSIYKHDREKFIMILSKQMRSLGTEQVFLITHNDIFQQSGLPVNIIMTTPENIDKYPNQSIMTIY